MQLDHNHQLSCRWCAWRGPDAKQTRNRREVSRVAPLCKVAPHFFLKLGEVGGSSVWLLLLSKNRAPPTHYQAHYAYCKNRERMVTGLPPATIEQWKRTSAPVCSVDRTRGKWRLYLNFSSRKGDKAKRKTGPAFDSRQSALEGMLAFRISWEYSHRGQPWVATEDHVVPRLGSGAVDTTLPAGQNTQLRRCTILTILIWTAAQQQHACGQQQHAFISCICLKYGWRWQQRKRLQTHTCLQFTLRVFFFARPVSPHNPTTPRAIRPEWNINLHSFSSSHHLFRSMHSLRGEVRKTCRVQSSY